MLNFIIVIIGVEYSVTSINSASKIHIKITVQKKGLS